MFSLIPKRSIWFAVALSVCFIATNTALASDDDDRQRTKTVNCHEPGASVQDEIDDADVGEDTTIFIVGFCDESVSIVKNGITLSGNKDGIGTIGGGLTEVVVTGAQRVQIEYLELTGDGYGVLAEEGAAVTITNSNIHDNEFDGVGAFNQVFVRVSYSTITGNGRHAPFFEGGITLSGEAIVRSKGNLISDNTYAAVGVYSNSLFRSGLCCVPPDPADLDIILQKGCLQGQTAGSCGDVDTLAFECWRRGTCDLRNTDVTGQNTIFGLSILEGRTTIINGDINASGGSQIHLRNTVTGSGTVSCSSNAFSSSFIQCGGTIP